LSRAHQRDRASNGRSPKKIRLNWNWRTGKPKDPTLPDGDWYKDFGTFNLSGQPRSGKRL